MRMPDDLSEAFASRHIGLSEDDENKMLAELGVATRADLIAQTVPATIRLDGTLALPPALTEPEALALLRTKAARNEVFTSLIGLGYSGTITPPVILRNVLENPAWYTAYTPYQPEISQGRLEALLNFQTMVADLTAMDLANASLLDEATAAAEAMTMSRRLSRHAGHVFFVDAGCHPQTIAVIQTRAEPIGIDVVVGDPTSISTSTSRSECCSRYPVRRAACATGRPRSSGSTRPAPSPRSSSICSRWRWSRRRVRWAPTSSSVRRSASVCPSASAVPTRRSWPLVTPHAGASGAARRREHRRRRTPGVASRAPDTRAAHPP